MESQSNIEVEGLSKEWCRNFIESAHVLIQSRIMLNNVIHCRNNGDSFDFNHIMFMLGQHHQMCYRSSNVWKLAVRRDFFCDYTGFHKWDNSISIMYDATTLLREEIKSLMFKDKFDESNCYDKIQSLIDNTKWIYDDFSKIVVDSGFLKEIEKYVEC